MDKADVYIIDNSSTLFEFASLDKPVVVLNPPWYRREINHGLRFWEFADVGVNCNNGGKLASCVDKALDDPSEIQKRRRQINNILYPIRDGSSSERAANEIEKIFT
jgi:CDP-glycerol glycerophosphotransferase (TagB/SpsB family)